MKAMQRRDAAVKRFLPTSNKISNVSVHPVQPWVALVDKNNGAQIWDWKTGEVLYTAQFGGIDENAMHYHSLQKMAEVDPAYWGAKVSQEHPVSKTPSGKLKSAEFLDVETLYWKRVRDLSIVKGRGGEILTGTVPGSAAIKKDRWIVFVCENKLLFHELISHKNHELSKMALDSKNPTSIAVVASPSDVMLAIGCNDGTIRLVSFSTFKTVVKLGYRSAQVTSLLTLHTTSIMTLIIAGTQEGNLHSYDPFPTVSAAGGSLPPITTVSKAHDGEILSMTLSYAAPNTTTPGIFVLDIYNALEATPDKCPVLIAAQNGIYGMTLSGGTPVKIVDAVTIAPVHLKKGLKLYHFTLHPLQRHWAMLATNAGVMVAKLDTSFLATAVSLPVPKTPKQSLELTCLRVKKQSLVQSEFMLVQQESSEDGIVRSVPETIMDREAFLLSEIFSSTGHFSISLSPDATKIAVSQQETNRFAILNKTGQTTWTPASEGQGCPAVWSPTSDAVATLDVTRNGPVLTSQRSLMRLRSAKADSFRGGSPDLPPPTIVKIFRLETMTPSELIASTSAPVMIHAGPLLGVTYSPRAGTIRRPFLFYSWETLMECSEELDAPEWLSCPITSYLPGSVEAVSRAVERFRLLQSVPVEEALSGMFKGDVLYVTTTTSIECVVFQRSKEKYERDVISSVHVVVLASFSCGPNWLTGEVELMNRAEKPRPIGHLKILDASSDRVWVIDSHEIPASIDITYPGFLALERAIEGEYVSAREAAMGKLSSDCLGKMLVKMEKKSAVEALKLPGLSLPLRLKAALEARYLKHALLCFQAIVHGCRRPEAVVRLPEFRETLKEKLPTPKKSSLESTGPSHLSPFSAVEGPEAIEAPITSAIGEESIDWDKALHLCCTPPLKKAERYVGREVLELGISLHDAALEERLYDVADDACSLVMQHCDEAKDGDLLIQLETRLSSRDQTRRLRDLVTITGRSRKSNYGQLKGLSAAVLCGDQTTLSEFLQNLNTS